MLNWICLFFGHSTRENRDRYTGDNYDYCTRCHDIKVRNDVTIEYLTKDVFYYTCRQKEKVQVPLRKLFILLYPDYNEGSIDNMVKEYMQTIGYGFRH